MGSLSRVLGIILFFTFDCYMRGGKIVFLLSIRPLGLYKPRLLSSLSRSLLLSSLRSSLFFCFQAAFRTLRSLLRSFGSTTLVVLDSCFSKPMAPKTDHSKLPPTTVLDHSRMNEGLLYNMVSLGMIADGQARDPPLPKEETSAHPHDDKIIIFCDLFIGGLRFLVDALVEILHLYKIYTHQRTPNFIVRLNLYFWLTKTCVLEPTTEGFAYAHKVLY